MAHRTLRLFAVPFALLLSFGPLHAQDVVIGTAFPYAPFITRDDAGDPAGAEAEILAAVCAHAGWTCTWVEMPFETLFTALQQGEIDIATNGLGATPERAARVHMSCPYYLHDPENVPAGTFFVTDPGHDPRSGPIGVTEGSIFEAALAREGLTAVLFQDEVTALQALHDGLVPAHLGSVQYPAQVGLAEGLFERGRLPTGSRGVSFALDPGDAGFIDRFEATLATVSRSGQLADLVTLHIGENHPDPVSECTVPTPIG